MRVYFDMDGVLADFDRGVVELCGMLPWDQAMAAGGNDDDWWAVIRTVDHYYGRLKLMPGAKEMFDYAYEKLGPDCQILSAVPKPKRGMPTAKEDKIEWCHRLLAPDVITNIVYREEKINFCTGKDCILVDDLEKNIVPWEENGGTGILHVDAESSLRRLKELLS